MREFKFRAWDNKAKEWLLGYGYGDLGGFSLFGECMLLGEWSHVLNEFILQQKYRTPDDLIVMQYTGLKDRNGKEIYEGDVIEYKSYSVFKRWWSDTKEIPVIEAECEAQRQDIQIVRNAVEFIDGGFMLGYHLTMRDVSRGQKFERGQSSHGDTESKEWDFEVIGNIYETPNLLK